MSDRREEAVRYARASREAVLADLKQFLSIPSVSQSPAEPAVIKKAANWLADRLRAVPLDRVEVLDTEGHPVVFGELKAADSSAPTVLMYGHYDVQSAAPLDDWETDPYEPTVRGDELYARGASDNKGMIMACVAAVESVVRAGGSPVNVKFLVEGEEEVGSTHLADFLARNRELLACDLVLNPDVGMLGPEAPTIFYGLRGMYMCRLRVTGPSQDLHSGGFGGVVHNPIHAMCELIAGLHDGKARVTLPGFYDSVRPVTEDERREMESLPLGREEFQAQSGAPELWGEPGYGPVERAGARPALDVVCLEAGTPKAAIPSRAEALVTVRLVPDQSPRAVHEQLVSYLNARTPATVRWEILEWEGFPATLTDRNAPGIRALSSAYETVWGKKPLYCRSGGSIAAVGQIQEILGVGSVLTGFSLPDDRVHGPNEKLHLPTWERGIRAIVHFLYNLPEEG